MKRFTAFLLVFMLFFSNIANDAIAAVSVGQANEVLQGDYVVIVNTNLENSQSTGSIIFDDSGLNINSSSNGSPLSKADNSNEHAMESLSLDGETKKVSLNSKAKTSYTLGQEKEIGPTGAPKKTYTLIGIGDKCYIWMENSLKAKYDVAKKTTLAADEMIKVYEGAPYEILNELSEGKIPYLDNSGKLSILLENTGGSAGYYGNEDDITSIHINTDDPAKFKEGGFDGLNGLLAHEGQHALFRLLTCDGDSWLANSYSWLNEGISVAVMDKVWGYSDSNGWLTRINDSNLLRNGSSLIYEDSRNTALQDYSVPYLFVRYLASQATENGNPVDFLKTIYKMDATKKTTEEFMNEIIAKIPRLNGKDFKDILGSFYVAAFAPEKDGVYSFYGDSVVTEKIKSYPIYLGESGKAMQLEPSAAIVVKTLNGSFKVPSDSGSDVRFYAVTKNNDIYKPAKGSGTAKDPYILTTEEELNSLGKYHNAYFELGNNIDIKKGSFFTAENFTGNLNGNGYTISNLNKPLVNNNNGSISNLIINANIKMDVMYNFGVIANTNLGLISDVKIKGAITLNGIGNNQVAYPTIGGIAGESQASGIIERVSFDANLSLNMPANSSIVGGIVGYNMGTVKNTYSKGSINVSQNNSGNFILNLGGIVGRYKSMGAGAALKTSYSTTNLTFGGKGTAIKSIGSIVGNLFSGARVTNSYGIETYDPIGNNPSDVAGKKSLTELQTESTFVNWDFNATWKMDSTGDGTPIFKDGNDIKSISGSLANNTFFVGEKLNLGPWDTLNVDGSNIELTAQMLNMDEFDSSTLGKDKVITGSYMGKNFEVSYNIVQPSTVSGLEIVEKGKTDYYVGEEYSDDGVVLRAKLDNSPYDKYIYLGFTNNLKNPLTLNDKEVEISYFGETVKQSITVKEKVVSSISVFKNADKSTYVPGNTVDLNGIRYQINYSDGSKTRILGYNDLNTYNLKVAQTDALGKNPVAFDLNKTLEQSDNNKKLHIYYGTALPGESGAISAEVLTLEVKDKLYMEDQTFRVVKGKENYIYSKSLLNGNYNVKTTLISGRLPDGITDYAKPNAGGYDYFAFEGIPTTVGTYKVTYRIEKLDGSDSIDVTFTFNVEEVSSEALLEALTLPKSKNPSLPHDIEGVIDNANSTIKFTVPFGTDVTKLQPVPTYYKNSSLPPHLINGAIVDFTKPVPYEVTAEDGVTKKTYMVSVEVEPENKVQLDKPTDLIWDGRKAKWRAVLNATTYELNIYKDNNLIQTIEVVTNEYDLTSFIKEAGEYSFTVVAKADGYSNSEESLKSPVFTFKNAKPVISGADDIEIVLGSTFDEKQWVTASDEEDNDLTSQIKVEGTVDTNTVGTYTLKYSVTDSDNNTTTVERIVIVKEKAQYKLDKVENLAWNKTVATWDKVKNATRYRVTLYRDDKLVVEKVVDENGQEVKALRNITNKVSYDFSKHFTDKGNYRFTVVAEADGYESSEVSGEADNSSNNNEVVFENLKPEIIAKNITINAGDSFNKLQGVEAFDKEDGNLINSVVVAGEVNTKAPGEYELTYSVTDSNGNTTTVKRVVTVKAVEPDGPVNPEEPEVPVQPEIPSNPVVPAPMEPEKPTGAVNVGTTITEEKPQTPVEPEIPVKSEDVKNEADKEEETIQEEESEITESNKEKLDENRSNSSVVKVSVLASLVILIVGLLFRRKRK